MKKNILIILNILLLTQSCSNFLDMKPQDIRVVSTIEDYRDLLASYMSLLKTVNPSSRPVLGAYSQYPMFDVSGIFPYYTGEVAINKKSTTYYDATLGEYKTNAVDLLTWMNENPTLWNRYYSFLGPVNLIIDGIETAEGDDERLRDYVKGEALVWRSFSYFKLLQYYSPYLENEYGVPVYLKPYEDPGNAMPKREMQTDVYKRILADCDEVFRLLERTPSTTWNCAYESQFVHSMLASIYCYKAMSAAAEKNDWQNAIEHADKAMLGRTWSRNQEAYDAIFNTSAQQIFTHDEFYLRFVDGGNRQIANFVHYYPAAASQADAFTDPELYRLYKDDDIRKETFFRINTDGSIINDKYNQKDLAAKRLYGGIILLYRLAEAKLIKAEALYRLGKTEEAKDVLDDFKKGRYLNIAGSYTETDLLNEILKERRLEFYHEQDMWWIDMKRLRTRMERVINGTVYVIEPDDFRYCMPIPKEEMLKNKNMFQNPGWDQINF